MEHSVEDCPGYNKEKMKEMREAGQNMEQLAEELNVKVHFLVNAAPAHVVFALLETDDYSSIFKLLNNVPLRQDFEITPVMHQKDLMKLTAEMETT